MSTAWKQTLSLIEARDYQQAAASLDGVRRRYEGQDEALWAAAVAITQRLCLMCLECSAVTAYHQRALSAMSEQLDRLNADLIAVIDLLQGLEAGQNGGPLAPLAPHHQSQDAQQTLWKRLQSLLGRARVVAQPALFVASPSWPSLPGPAPDQPSADLAVCCLGPFRVYQYDRVVGEWASRKGKSVFKYLITHREHPVSKEVLMELLWPDSSPDAARNNLNVAIYGLRQSLRQDNPHQSHILYQDDCYFINPDLNIWVDVEAFEAHLARACQLEVRAQSQAVHEYHLAETLYTGDFLEEDRYEDWPAIQRQQLKDAYLGVLERLSQHYYAQGDYAACVAQCQKILAAEPYRESAHRWIMQCYAQQGQRYLAIRQYQDCVDALRNELDVEPSEETDRLYQRVLSGEKTGLEMMPWPVLQLH